MGGERKELYLASPLGFSEAGKVFYYQEFIPTLEKIGFGILDPWKLTDEGLVQQVLEMKIGEERKEAWGKLNLIIFQNNIEAIQRSSGIVAILDGTDVESGAASEIGYGFALKKSILGYRGDFRLSSENEGGIVSLQVEGFIRSSGGTIITQISQLEESALNIFGKP